MNIPLHYRREKNETGIVLLEGLIAIFIFSLGILALVGTQAVAIKQSTDARYRSEAALLAEQLIGTMWVDDRTTLSTKYSTGGAGYTAWLAQVRASLPKVSDNPPEVTVNDGEVTVTIYWSPPGDTSGSTRRRYVATSHIK